jgi:hypothetical protein
VLESAETGRSRRPTRQRLGEVEQAIAELRRRLRNQLLSLEDDDLKPEARRHITSRIAQLEQAIADHQASLAKLHDELDLPMAAMDALVPRLIGCRCSRSACGSCPNASCGVCSTAWT